MGGGLFNTPHFMNAGYNRSMMTASPLQTLSNPNMILYNAANNLRPFQSPAASTNPLHPLTPDFGILSAAGSSAANSAAALAMQAAAAQAATYQNSLKSAANLVNEMRNSRIGNGETNGASSLALAASLSHQYGNPDRHSILSGLSTSLTSPNVGSATSKNVLRDTSQHSS